MSEKQEKTMRQLQAEAMRIKLQTIVMEMVKTKTLDDIRIKDICTEANISMGNFYQYFDSKEAALIYSYKCKDECWRLEKFEEIKDPLKRVEKILATHLASMTENGLCFDTQLYISQLKKYEPYFFTEDRYLHKIMIDTIVEGQALNEFKKNHTAKEIAIRLLNFSRGLVYNYCIEHQEDNENWLKYAIECQSEYLSLFVEDDVEIDIEI